MAELLSPQWVDVRRACEILTLGRDSIHRMIRAGRLQAIRVGERGKYLIRRESLERLIADAEAMASTQGAATAR